MSRHRRAPTILLPLLAGLLGACSSCPPLAPARPAHEASVPAPAAAAPAAANPVASLPQSEWPPNYRTIQLKISGMTCPITCVREVKELLERVPGVLHVVVDYDDREATVDVVPGTDPETVVHGLGGRYSGRLM